MIKERKLLPIIILFFIMIGTSIYGQTDPTVQVSADFLKGIRNGENVDAEVKKFAGYSQAYLKEKLDTDTKKMAFWVNVYNGFIQYFLKGNPSAYDDRGAFFAEPKIEIAGRKMSFADIEHGIIRRSQFELFLGFLTNPFAPEYQKALRVDKKDFRAHFALNCGAKSCPSVAIYTDDQFEKKIQKVSSDFLQKTTTYDAEKDHAKVVALFSWFRGDFGGGDGIRKILLDYKVVPKQPENVSITEYDWTLDLDNWWRGE